MVDVTMDTYCVRHPQIQSVGNCDRCGKSFCAECRIEDIAAEKIYCSKECHGMERKVENDTQLTSDQALLQGYESPHSVGMRTWRRSLRALSISIAPLAVITAVIFAIWGTSLEAVLSQGGSIIFAYIALAVYGMALVGVVVSRTHTGQAGDNPHIQTLQRFLSWLIAWVLMVGITMVGYIFLVIPGIYLNLRVFWADEFTLAHRVNPFKALDESWQVSRNQAGETFGLEFALGFVALPVVIAVVIPLALLYMGLELALPDLHAADAFFAGAVMFMYLIGYAFLHSTQISFFYALRAMRAKEPVSADQKPMPKMLQWIGVPAGMLVILFLGFGLLIETGTLVSPRVLSGDKIPDYQLEVLLSERIVYEDEVVEYFFSKGVLSVREGGSVLTNQRVIAYYAGENDEIDMYHIYVEDIGSVDLVQQGDAMNYSVYKIITHDGERWLELLLPHEYGDDKRFITAVEAKIQE